MKFKVAIISLLSSFISCNEVSDDSNSQPNKELSYEERIASDFSTGSLFMAISVLDTQSGKSNEVVIENNYLYELLKQKFSTSDRYTDYMINLLKQNDTLLVDSQLFHALRHSMVKVEDTLLEKMTQMKKGELLLSFFVKNEQDFVKCFGNNDSLKNQVIYTLINKWSILVATDDESGCTVINAKLNNLE